MFVYIIMIVTFLFTFCFILIVCLIVSLLFQYLFCFRFVCFSVVHLYFMFYSHIRPLGAAGALAVDICICFHDIESYIFAKLFPSLAV